MRLAESGLLGLIGLVALLVVVRPMAIRLSGLAEPADPIGMEASFARASGAPLPALTGPPGSIAAGQPSTGAGAGGRGPAAEPDDDGMINIANIDGQMRASSLRKIGELVEKHPDEALAIDARLAQPGRAADGQARRPSLRFRRAKGRRS